MSSTAPTATGTLSQPAGPGGSIAIVGTAEDRQLKARHRALWAVGDYAAVAAEVIPTLGESLVRATGIGPDHRVLDVAAGTGNAAIPAARTGAEVVASDLTPELLAIGAAHAEDQGLALSWEEGDAEALPYADATFDRVVSCLGVMFAPHHEAAAAELLRVARPGGSIGLLSWTPQGFIGRMFATMKPFVPGPPPGAKPPVLWGDADHVRDLLGDGVTGVEARTGTAPIEAFSTAEDFLDYFKRNYGPTVMAYRGLADQPDRATELDEQLLELARAFDLGGGRMEWEYLLFTGRRTEPLR